MAIELSALTQTIGAEVHGVDISRAQTAAEARQIHAAMDRYAVLVIRGQRIDGEQQLAFTRSLGPIEQSRGTSLRAVGEQRLPPVFADVSNLDVDNRPFAVDDRRRLFAIGNRLWHSDSSFKTVPAKYSLLYAVQPVERGGNTEFAHMGAAYDALDAETKAEIEDLECEHSQMYSRLQMGFTDFTEAERARFAPVRQRLVRTVASTGRRSLFLSSHAGRIVGWPVPEALSLLKDLNEHATQPGFVYVHRWQPGDLVIWDNRQTMHRVRRFPPHLPRDMRRTTIAGDGPTVVPRAA